MAWSELHKTILCLFVFNNGPLELESGMTDQCMADLVDLDVFERTFMDGDYGYRITEEGQRIIKRIEEQVFNEGCSVEIAKLKTSLIIIENIWQCHNEQEEKNKSYVLKTLEDINKILEGA